MSTFGTLFRVTTFGESHGTTVGCIVDGCPPGLLLCEADIQPYLNRRRPGQNEFVTQRNEPDIVYIMSGVENGVTLGTPIAMQVRNRDQRPVDYDLAFPRPSHADITYQLKYGIKASSGGGRASARETVGRVAAGAIAENVLKQIFGIDIVAFVSSIGSKSIAETLNIIQTVTKDAVYSNIMRCPCSDTATSFEKLLIEASSCKDSLGGIVTCVVRNIMAGVGEPVFDKLPAVLAHAMMSIPASRGFEIGRGFSACAMRGSEHNDIYVPSRSSNSECLGVVGATNNAGGVVGGISDGRDIKFSVAFKPPSSISFPQHTCNYAGEMGLLVVGGRHDPSVVVRAVPVVEAMAAIAILDLIMQQKARESMSSTLFGNSLK